jgi:hypothetical protein
MFATSLMLAGCGRFGTVNQGRVVAFDRAQGLVTLISDSNYRDPDHPRFDRLPPLTVRVPADSREMGPDPQPGLLLQLDCAHAGALYFDPPSESLRTVPCTAVPEGAPGAINTWSPRQRQWIAFTVPTEFRALPPETWRFGDEIRYYYKDPAIALRLMNITRTN